MSVDGSGFWGPGPGFRIECGVLGGECGAWSVKCSVLSVGCGVLAGTHVHTVGATFLMVYGREVPSE